MVTYRKRTVGVALAAVLLVGGATACESGKKDGAGKAAGASAEPAEPAVDGKAAQALTVAYKKTSAAKSAKVRMTMTMPSAADGGTVEMTGVQGWDPAVMDITVKGRFSKAAVPGTPESMRMITSNNVMYMDMGAEHAADMDGKRWMKMDLKAVAEAAGGEGQNALGGMSGMNDNQDPAKQLALLLDSPNVKQVGSEKADGVDTDHYRGTLTFEEMLAAKESSKLMPEGERKQLADTMKKAGIKGYDTDVWVNKDGYPVRMKVGMDTGQGAMTMDAHYSDYGAAATVQTPPDNETFDFFGMLSKLKDTGDGA